jgi:hypothetical protein
LWYTAFASRRQQTSLPPTVARKGKRWFATLADAPRKGKMDQDHLRTYEEVRKTLIERLTRLSFTETMLEKMSVFQLVSLLHLMAGHLNYLPTYTIAVRTLEEMFGEIIWEKPGGEEPKIEEPKPAVVH